LSDLFDPSTIYAEIGIADSGSRSHVNDFVIPVEVELHVIDEAKDPGSKLSTDIVIFHGADPNTGHALNDLKKPRFGFNERSLVLEGLDMMIRILALG
jgi:hypothetical protein